MKMLKPRAFHYKDGFKQPHSLNKQNGPFYGKFYFSLANFNEEKILNSPFNWILKLLEEEYVKKINTVREKFKVKKSDERFQALKNTGLFDDKVIKNFIKRKDKKELDKIINPKPKISPW